MAIWDKYEFTNDEKKATAFLFYSFFDKFLDSPFINNPIIQYGHKKEIDKLQLLVHANLQSLQIDLKQITSFQVSNSIWDNMSLKKKDVILIILNLFLDECRGNDLFESTAYSVLINIIAQLRRKFTGDLKSGFRFV